MVSSTMKSCSLTRDEERIEVLDKMVMRLYEDMIAGRISEQNFNTMLEKTQTEQAELKAKVSEGRKRLSDEVQLANDAKQWVEAIQEYANITELNAATLNRLIKEISAVLLLLINLLVFGITQYNQKKSREFTEMQLLLQKESDSAEYYKMLLSQNENRSILIHDIKKHLQSIKLLNEKGESEKIDAYILQLMDASDLKETARICSTICTRMT